MDAHISSTLSTSLITYLALNLLALDIKNLDWCKMRLHLGYDRCLVNHQHKLICGLSRMSPVCMVWRTWEKSCMGLYSLSDCVESKQRGCSSKEDKNNKLDRCISSMYNLFLIDSLLNYSTIFFELPNLKFISLWNNSKLVMGHWLPIQTNRCPEWGPFPSGLNHSSEPNPSVVGALYLGVQRSENPQNVTCECKEKGVQAIGDCCLERREKEGVFEKSWKDETQHPIKNL